MPRRRPGAAVLAAVVVAAAAWVSGVGPGGGDTVGASTCGPAPAGRVAVVVVVDDGVRSPSVRCVEVADRATGYDVLIAAGHRLRIEAGFLCAIDGHPATGCANRPDFDGSYWRYFHATPGGPWSYSNVGGGGYRMPPRCAIEGWRFSGAAGTNVAPRTSPPPVRCDSVPVTTAPRPAAPPPAPAPAPSSPRPTQPAAPAAPSAPGAPGAPSQGAGSGTPADPGGAQARNGNGGGPGSPRGDTPTDSDDPDAEVHSAEDLADAGTSEEDRSGEDEPVDDPDADGDDGSEDEDVGAASDSDERAAAVDGSGSAGPGSPVGVVLVGLLILGLVVASLVRSRRRVAAAEPADPRGNA